VFRRPVGRRIDVGHSRLAYYRFGAGPDLLLIHGWPLHAATFRHLLPQLARHYTCHLLDLPGAGQTGCGPDTPIGLRAHADTVLKAVDALGLERYGIVAHDSGAVIARQVAARDARVAALAFSGSEIAGFRPPKLRLMVTLGRTALGRRLLMRGMRLRLVQRSELGLGGCFTDLRYAQGEFGELFIQPLLSSQETSAGQWRLLQDFDWGLIDHLSEVHARIQVPVLAVWGSEDPWFPVARLQPTLSQFPAGATLRVVPGAKLFVHEDRPQDYLAHVLPYLAERLHPPA
jgi:pimeloyl-ACP methyl ester carboxylesterase